MLKLAAALTLALLLTTDAFAGNICDRTITYDSLAAWEKILVDRYSQVSRFEKQPNGYSIGYLFARTKFDSQTAMAVYSSCGEHAGRGGLGDFIVRSKIVSDEARNPFRVFYEQQVGWPYSNGEYTVETEISEEQGGYILNSKLVDSTDSGFSPKFADAYVRFVPHGQDTFVVACNYMIPRTSSWKGKYNDLARERLAKSGENLLSWVRRVAAEPNLAERYRDRLRRLLGR